MRKSQLCMSTGGLKNSKNFQVINKNSIPFGPNIGPKIVPIREFDSRQNINNYWQIMKNFWPVSSLYMEGMTLARATSCKWMAVAYSRETWLLDSVATFGNFPLSTCHSCCVNRNQFFKSSVPHLSPCPDNPDCHNLRGSKVDRAISIATTALMTMTKPFMQGWVVQTCFSMLSIFHC